MVEPCGVHHSPRRLVLPFVYALLLALGCGDEASGAADGSAGDGRTDIEQCANGLDDDGDGDTDCADLDCLVPALDATAPTRTWEAMAWVVQPQSSVASCPPPQTHQGEVLPAQTLPRARVAAVHGRVLDETGSPFSGAVVRVFHRSPGGTANDGATNGGAMNGSATNGSATNWGATSTHADGRFDLLVDPRSNPVLLFEAAERLPAQRALDLLDGEQRALDDVVLIRLSKQATTVQLGSAATAAQVARGPLVRDDDGERRATLVFPSGVEARAQMPDGSEMPLASLTVRATEYTVGDRGLEAMPGALPSVSAYTYAVELSSDEARAMGADGVAFDRPVSFYVDNFLGFSVGTPVPLGFYDRTEGRWEAEPDGVVMAIVGENDGLAEVDTDGDGAADSADRLDALGITDEERRALGATYAPSAELWRTRLEHFSPWDLNWPFGFPDDAIFPNLFGVLEALATAACTVLGSVVDCENQTLGESVAIEGTGHSMHYQSERALGFESLRRIDIPLLAEPPPPSLKRIDVRLVVAGQRIERSIDPATDARFTYTWDGRDSFGRQRQGATPYRLVVTYVYDGVYRTSRELFGLTFAQPGDIQLEGSRTREEVGATRILDGTFHVLDATRLGLGGFTLDVHHTYDPRSGTLHLGNGHRRSQRDIGWAAEPIAGGGSNEGLGVPVEEAALDARGVAVGPNGLVYLSDERRHRIVRRERDGTLGLVAGTGAAGYSGDGGPATEAELRFPTALDFGPDGSLYFTSGRVGDATYVVRRIDPVGIITTVAGNGTQATEPRQGDGGPATEAALSLPRELAVAPDGALWIVSDSISGIGSHFRVVDPSGRITTLFIDTDTLIQEVAFGRSDRPYFTVGSGNDARLYRLLPDGRARLLAGGDDAAPALIGVPGRDARYAIQPGLAVAPDGRVFLGAYVDGHALVLELDRDHVLRPIAGGGSGERCPGGAASSAHLGRITALALSPDGELIVGGAMIDGASCRMQLPFATVDRTGLIRVPAPDGSAVFVFDERGRHLRTVSAFTGENLWSFEYQAGTSGPLVRVTDGDGNTTTIHRASGVDGIARAIEGPFGHRTKLELDGEGRTTAVFDPMGRVTRFAYGTGDLLARMTDPEGGEHLYAYDAIGRIAGDTNASAGTQTFSPTREGASEGVRHQTPEARSRHYQRSHLPDGGFRRSVIDRAGNAWLSENHRAQSLLQRPDGTVVGHVQGSDPRFGMVAPVSRESVIQLPSGLTSVTTGERTVRLDGGAPAGLAELVDRVTHGDRTSTHTWTGATQTWRTVTASGRDTESTVDTLGRPLRGRVASLPETSFERDTRGRLVEIRREAGGAARVASFAYGEDGLLATTSNGAGDASTFERDTSGWLIAYVDGEGRRSAIPRDALGAVTQLVRPGGAMHAMRYDPDGRVTHWTRPEGGITSYGFDGDGVMTRLAPPSGRDLVLSHDSAGRLVRVTVDGETETHAYEPNTGRPSRSVSTTGEQERRTYDGFLLTQLAREGVASSTVAWRYDEDLRATEETVEAGASAPSLVSWRYDADGLLLHAGALSLARDPSTGLLDSTEVGIVSTTLSRDAFGEVERAIASAGAARLYDATYTRDEAARLVRETTQSPGLTEDRAYAYDSSGKLTKWRQGGAPRGSYSYDARGLRTRTEDDRGAATATYDGDDRLTSFGSRRFTYDEDGYRSATLEGSTRTAFAHDPLGQLRTVTLPSGRRLTYRYDIHGQRVARAVGDAPDRAWVYGSALGPIAELDASGDLRSRFVYATAAHVPDLMVRAGVTYRFLHDARGSVRQVVRASDGAVVQALDYDPWGRILRDTNPGFQPFAFAGGLRDPDTGLLRMGLRDYDPHTGRFLTPDPIGMLGGEDLYAYADDDPVNFIDPAGTHPLLFALGAAVGCQLLQSGGDWSAIDWGQVALAVAFDFFGGPLINGILSTAGKAGRAAAKKLLAGAGIGGAGLGAGALGMAARRASRRGGQATTSPRAGAGARGRAETTFGGGRGPNSSEQDALVQMARQDRRIGISEADARAYRELGGEVDVRVRGPESHPNRPAPTSRQPHIHVGPVDHIPVRL